MTQHISTIAIATRNRPAFLFRCIESFARNARSYGRDVRFVISDNTSNPAVRRRIVEGLKVISRASAIDVDYCGCAERLKYLPLLTKELDTDPKLASFAIDGYPRVGPCIGANRNTLLLSTIDERVLSVEDDTVCAVAAHPQRSSCVLVTDCGDPTQIWFLKSRSIARRLASQESVDVVGLFERVLGRSLEDLSREHPGLIDDCLLLFPPSRKPASVRLVSSGVIGDSGFHSVMGMIAHRDVETHKRLTENIKTYASAVESREVLRVARQLTVTALTASCGFGAMAYDNTTLLPPFVPTFRNEDGMYGSTISLCDPAMRVAHLPYAILHDASARPRTKRMLSDCVADIRFCDILNICQHAQRATLRGAGVLERLKDLGDQLCDVAVTSQDIFHEHVVRLLRNDIYSRIAMLQEMVRQRPSAPHFWVQIL